MVTQMRTAAKKLCAKIVFDAGMTAVWIILMVYHVTGSFWHEAIGLTAFALFAVHLGYNRKRIAAEVPRMFSSGAFKTTIRYLASGFLTVGIIFTGISGILISKHLLTGIVASNIYLWTALHNWVSYITLALIGVHIGLHLKMIGGLFSYLMRAHSNLVTMLRRCWNAAAALLIVCGVFATIHYDLPSITSASEEVSSPDAPNNDSQPFDSAHAQFNDPDLNEYLGSLFCTLCYKCCPLNALQCNRGNSARDEAVQEYYAAVSLQETVSSDAPANDSSENPDLLDVIAIMGLYVGGTHYVSKISKKRKIKDDR